MRNIRKITLTLIVLLMALILAPNTSKAAKSTYEVDNGTEFAEKVEAAETGDTIVLSEDIEIDAPVEISDKDITIEGNNFSITKSASWSTSSANGTLITAGKGAKVILQNITLTGSQKYGAQAYNGGHLVLNNVTAENNAYGGVMANGGTIEIIKLTLGKNRPEGNNGIEIARGSGIDEENIPVLIMNGELISEETEGVITIATNNQDSLHEFKVENGENAVDKIFIDEGKVIVTDSQNRVLFTSNEGVGVEAEGETFVENAIATVYLKDKKVLVSVERGTTLSKERLMSEINLEELGLTNYNLTGFYSDANYETVFDFEKVITDDIDIFAKLDHKNTDRTPATGTKDYVGLAILLMVSSIAGIIYLKKKD